MWPFKRKLTHEQAVARLQKYGPEVVRRVHGAMTSGNFTYWVDAGTLLGFVRDGGFIKHDTDLDFSVPGDTDPARLLRHLLDQGFCFQRAFSYDGKITELTFVDHEISLDIFWEFKFGADECWAHCYKCFLPCRYPRGAKMAQRLYRPLPRGLHEIEILGVRAVVPQNSEEILAAHYGPTWRNPIANWVPSEDDPRRRFMGKLGYKITSVRKVFRLCDGTSA